MGDLEGASGGDSHRVHDSFRDLLPIEVRQLLGEVLVLQQQGTPGPALCEF